MQIGTTTTTAATATTLADRANSAIEQWEAAVRQRAPRYAQFAPDELRGKIPAIVAHARHVGGRGMLDEDGVAELAAEHARLRAAQGVDVESLCAEFQILRREILNSPSSHDGTDPDALARCCDTIDAAQRHAVASLFERQSRELSRAHEAFNEFLSFMSHDLRGGLNGALLMAEVIRRDLVTRGTEFGALVDDLDMIRSSLFGTVANLERYLYAERFRRGKVATRMSPFDLAALVQEQMKRFAYEAKEKGITLRADAPATLPVTTDRGLVSLILGNLICNAIKHGEATGGSEVRIILERPGDDAGSESSPRGFRLTVEDHGKGIAADALSKLLHPTPEQDAAVNAKTGLGLYNCRHAANEIGGKLTAESIVGRGSRFSLEVQG